MAEIRLSKLTKQFSIGLARLVDFLNEKGANVEMNPNAKVSDEYLPAIEAKFGEDQKLKEDSEKVTIKLKEIIEMGSGAIEAIVESRQAELCSHHRLSERCPAPRTSMHGVRSRRRRCLQDALPRQVRSS